MMIELERQARKIAALNQENEELKKMIQQMVQKADEALAKTSNEHQRLEEISKR